MTLFNRGTRLLLCILMILGSYSVFAAETIMIEDIVNNSSRFAADIKRDAARKPVQVLKFSTIKPGDTVLDLFSGAGYYTDLISRLVGKDGVVLSHNNNAYIKFLGDDADSRYKDNRLPNVQRIVSEANTLTLENKNLDVVMLVLTFHDFYYISQDWKKIDVTDILAKIKNALKDTGSVIIIDHVAVAGSAENTGGTLHRVDPAIVKTRMKEAGFKLVAESDFLKNDKDPLTISMGDPKIRGNTSRFVLRYQKDN